MLQDKHVQHYLLLRNYYGLATVCQGQTGVVYTVPAITGATIYNWTIPTGATLSPDKTQTLLLLILLLIRLQEILMYMVKTYVE